MRLIVLSAAAVMALSCLLAGTTSVLTTTAVGGISQRVAADEGRPPLLRQDQSEQAYQADLKLQVQLVRGIVPWYLTREWAVVMLLALLIVTIWIVLASAEVRRGDARGTPDPGNVAYD